LLTKTSIISCNALALIKFKILKLKINIYIYILIFNFNTLTFIKASALHDIMLVLVNNKRN